MIKKRPVIRKVRTRSDFTLGYLKT